MTDEDEWERELEAMPIFVASQLRAGHVLTEDDAKAIQAIVSELDDSLNNEVDAFHKGRENAFLEIGGHDLLTSVQIKDEERIAHHVRKAMDKMFPKNKGLQ